MPFIVTLHVYSQRPDPTWILSSAEAARLLDLVRSLPERTALKARDIGSRDGYRGFSVSSVPSGLYGGTQLAINEGIVDLGRSQASFFDRDRGLERWLLSTAADPETRAAIERVGSALDRPAADALRARAEALLFRAPVGKCPSKAADAPVYDPAAWNTPAVQPCNNCYNYANNQITQTYAQPGLAHGVAVVYSCSGVGAAAAADGLVQVADFAGQLGPGEGWYVALAVDPGNDAHWYRQDADGCWSHKLGADPVSNLDFHDNTITDPRTCARGGYDFCTFMISNRSVVIR